MGSESQEFAQNWPGKHVVFKHSLALDPTFFTTELHAHHCAGSRLGGDIVKIMIDCDPAATLGYLWCQR